MFRRDEIVFPWCFLRWCKSLSRRAKLRRSGHLKTVLKDLVCVLESEESTLRWPDGEDVLVSLVWVDHGGMKTYMLTLLFLSAVNTTAHSRGAPAIIAIGLAALKRDGEGGGQGFDVDGMGPARTDVLAAIHRDGVMWALCEY